MQNKEFRLLLTQDCNYACKFCHNEGIHTRKKLRLDNHDYEFILQTGYQKFGWDTVSLSGGEPLLYPNFDDLVSRIGNLGIRTTVITNGSYQISNESLRIIDGFAISLHTTNQEKYNWLTGADFPIDTIKRRIIDAKRINPVLNIRINTAISNGFNSSSDEIERLIEFACDAGCNLKLIELCARDNDPNYFQVSRLQSLLAQLGFILCNENDVGSMRYSDSKTHITLSKTPCHKAKELGEYTPICEQKYNPSFIAGDGSIKPCMNNPYEINALPSVKNRDAETFTELLNVATLSLPRLCPYGK